MAGKRQLVAKIREGSGLTIEQAEKALNLALGAIKDITGNGEKVTIQEFGVFEVRERKAREYRNPQNGASIAKAAHAKLTFRELKLK